MGTKVLFLHMKMTLKSVTYAIQVLTRQHLMLMTGMTTKSTVQLMTLMQTVQQEVSPFAGNRLQIHGTTPALVVGHNDVNYAANTNRSFRTILTTDATDMEPGAIINMNDGQDEDTGVLTPNMWGPGDGLNISYDANGTTDPYNRIQGVFVMEPRGRWFRF